MEKKDKVFLIGDKPKNSPNYPDIDWIPKNNRYITGTIHRINVPATLAPVFPFDPWNPPMDKLKAYKPIKFKDYYFWCKENFPFIENQFDATTTYEMFCELYKYFRQVVIDLGIVQDNVDILGKNYLELYAAFLQLEKIFNDLKDYLIQYIEEFQEFMISKFNEFTEDITNKFEQFKTDILNQFETFKTNLTNEWNAYKLNLNNEWNAFQQQINNTISNLQQEWANYQTNLNKEWADFKTYVENYLDNLDIQQYVDNRIQQLIDEGYFNELVQNFVNLEWAKIKPTLPNWWNLKSVGEKDNYSQDVVNNKDSEIYLPRNFQAYIDYNSAKQAHFVGEGIIKTQVNLDTTVYPKAFNLFPVIDFDNPWDYDLRYYGDNNIKLINNLYSDLATGVLYKQGMDFNAHTGNFLEFRLVIALNPNFVKDPLEPFPETNLNITISPLNLYYSENVTNILKKLPPTQFNQLLKYEHYYADDPEASAFGIDVTTQMVSYRGFNTLISMNIESDFTASDMYVVRIKYPFGIKNQHTLNIHEYADWLASCITITHNVHQTSPYLTAKLVLFWNTNTGQQLDEIGYTAWRNIYNNIGYTLHFCTFTPDSHHYAQLVEDIKYLESQNFSNENYDIFYLEENDLSIWDFTINLLQKTGSPKMIILKFPYDTIVIPLNYTEALQYQCDELYAEQLLVGGTISTVVNYNSTNFSITISIEPVHGSGSAPDGHFYFEQAPNNKIPLCVYYFY